MIEKNEIECCIVCFGVLVLESVLGSNDYVIYCRSIPRFGKRR